MQPAQTIPRYTPSGVLSTSHSAYSGEEGAGRFGQASLTPLDRVHPADRTVALGGNRRNARVHGLTASAPYLHSAWETKSPGVGAGRGERKSGMTMGKARSAAPHWPRRATGTASQSRQVSMRQVTVAALLADVLYRVAIRSHVRRAIGI